MRQTVRHVGMILGVVGMAAAMAAGCSETVKPDPAGAVDNLDPMNPSDWSCPENSLVAKMVLITAMDGKPYCIDEREVVYGEYKTFVEAKKDDFSGQPPECEWNKDYGPVEVHPAWYADVPPQRCGPSLSTANPDRAVQCTDFCDAWAFCAWAGKRLCGLRGAEHGKVALVSTSDDNEELNVALKVTRTTQSEWNNVCTQGGTSKFPYGDELVRGICIDSTMLAARGDAAYDSRNTSKSECHGTQPPYDQVWNMSGSIPQWLNICVPYECVSHGGRLGDDGWSCGGTVGLTSIRTPYFGIRCCSDVIPKVLGR